MRLDKEIRTTCLVAYKDALCLLLSPPLHYPFRCVFEIAVFYVYNLYYSFISCSILLWQRQRLALCFSYTLAESTLVVVEEEEQVVVLLLSGVHDTYHHQLLPMFFVIPRTFRMFRLFHNVLLRYSSSCFVE